MALIALGMGTAALGGYFLRYFTSETEKKEQIQDSQINSVIVTDTVEVENHVFIIIGIFLIVGILLLFGTGICIRVTMNNLKKKYSRRTRVQAPVIDIA